MKLKPQPDFAIHQVNVKAPFRYSVCTLVSNMQEYVEMVDSFLQAGFDKTICEYRYIDNSKANSFEAFEGYNLFLQHAQGEYIVFCHQDVLLNFNKITDLDRCIAEVASIDDNWAILSNAGGLENDLYKRFVLNIAYPGGRYDRVGSFPQKIMSADENFIVVKRSANLALSHDLRGFHLYGTDICLVADLLGYSAYVIDFKLTHKSLGKPDDSYYETIGQLVVKYGRFMRSRRIVTTIADFYLSASNWQGAWAGSKWGKKISRKITKIKSGKKGRHNGS